MLAVGLMLAGLGAVVLLLTLAGSIPKGVEPWKGLATGGAGLALGAVIVARAPRAASFAGRIRIGPKQMVVVGGGWFARELTMPVGAGLGFSVETTSTTAMAGTDFRREDGQAQSFQEATFYAYEVVASGPGQRPSPVAVFRDRACAAWMATRLAELTGGKRAGFG